MRALPPLLEVTGLAAGYGGGPVIAGVGFAVPPGGVVALLGANGAGRSTLLRALVGLTPVAAGEICFAGAPITRLGVAARVRRGIGYAPEGRRVFPGMNVRDTLLAASRAPRAGRRAALDRVFDLFPQLAASAGRRAWQLSGGQQQMLALGRALMGEPRLVLLDSPSLGLAPPVVADVFGAIAAIVADGVAAVIAEDRLAPVDRVADRALVLRAGRVVADTALAALSEDRLADLALGAAGASAAASTRLASPFEPG